MLTNQSFYQWTKYLDIQYRFGNDAPITKKCKCINKTNLFHSENFL